MKKITKNELRMIDAGETFVFELPTYAACLSARTLAYTTARCEGRKYAVSIHPTKNEVSITRTK